MKLVFHPLLHWTPEIHKAAKMSRYDLHICHKPDLCENFIENIFILGTISVRESIS